MKRTITMMLLLLVPLSLCAMDQLSESVLSDFSTNNSLNVTAGKDADSGKFWIRYYNDPANLEFNEESSSGNQETQATRTFQGIQTDQTATVTAVGPEDKVDAGMSRIGFSNGLTKGNEGSTQVDVWLGGLATDRNAGKMCDFYSNQINSFTHPNSSINVSTH